MFAMMQLTDSAVPTGAFSHSLGFETYMHREILVDEASFSAWLEMFIKEQLCYTDALAIRLAYSCASGEELADLDELLTAATLPQQVREGTATMGRRLLALASMSYPSAGIQDYSERVATGQASSHPALVWGMLARELKIAEDEAVASHLYATVISLTQNAVRAIPLGQNTGQRIIRAAQGWVKHATSVSAQLSPDDLGAIAPGLEIAQMNHERQRARMFMS
ncbi:MAG: urease accessory protein UreF [Rothia sp. (in: high G+C Gram-positive bacteria)]|nr:urease accessory protein UreF [Rothia sp. (in: high G+C Gram-positive bacteria)]